MSNHYFCLAHTDLLYAPPSGTKIIGLGDFNLNTPYSIKNSKKNLYNNFKFLHSAAGLFFINELIQDYPDSDFINILAYRKFALPEVLGQIDFPINIKENTFNEKKGAQQILNIKENYCFCHPTHSISTLTQYRYFHNIQDILKFTSCAVEIGVVNKDEVELFFNFNVLIPSGIELGKFPVKTFKQIVSKLELVTDLFLKTQIISDPNDLYQKRALAFCCERLSSWLLIKHLEQEFKMPLIKNGNLIAWNNTGLIDKNYLNYSNFFGYMHQVS